MLPSSPTHITGPNGTQQQMNRTPPARTAPVAKFEANPGAIVPAPASAAASASPPGSSLAAALAGLSQNQLSSLAGLLGQGLCPYIDVLFICVLDSV